VSSAAVGGPGAGEWDARLRAAGLRSTGQRRAVLQAIDALRHATVDELAAEVQGELPEVSLSTIYRILETLDDAGLVTHAHLHHGSPTWHVVDGDPHLHLVCAECGQVEQQPVGIALALADSARDELGFVVDLRHLVLHGRCSACAGGSPGAGPVLDRS
jgi:Fur family ferric uptake transcriptional regulator